MDEAVLGAFLTRVFNEVLTPRRRFARVLLQELLKGSEAVAPTIAALNSLITDALQRFERAGVPLDEPRNRVLWMHFGLVPALFAVATPHPLVAGIDPASLGPELAGLEAVLLRGASTDPREADTHPIKEDS